MSASAFKPHVASYCDYIVAVLKREKIPVVSVWADTRDDFAFAVSVQLHAPWEQYNHHVKPGTWLRTIRRGETVHDLIAMYRRAYPAQELLP